MLCVTKVFLIIFNEEKVKLKFSFVILGGLDGRMSLHVQQNKKASKERSKQASKQGEF
ncbi:MAG: hypothetical protein LBS29_06420 [Endomicrobium sp.]|nr:hypothetical protein [Endomicrobium sp.]